MTQAIAPALIIYRIVHGISIETDERGTAVTGSLQFSGSVRPRPIMRSVHRDFFDTSGTMHASVGESVKTDRDSFIQEVKEDSQV